MLKDCWHFIKKHVDLTRCSADGINALKKLVGYQIVLVDGGYHLMLMFLPTTVVCCDTRLLNKECYRSNACEVYHHIVWEFQRQLQIVSHTEKVRATLQKLNSRSTDNYNVLMKW